MEAHITGPSYGYFPKAAKTYAIVKPELLDSSREIFEVSGIQVTANGQRHLGAAIGLCSFAEGYVAEKVKLWSEEIPALPKQIRIVLTLLSFTS